MRSTNLAPAEKSETSKKGIQLLEKQDVQKKKGIVLVETRPRSDRKNRVTVSNRTYLTSNPNSSRQLLVDDVEVDEPLEKKISSDFSDKMVTLEMSLDKQKKILMELTQIMTENQKSNQQKSDHENILLKVLKKLDSIVEELKIVRSELHEAFSEINICDKKKEFWIEMKNVQTLIDSKKYNAALIECNEVMKFLTADSDDQEIIFTCYMTRGGIYEALNKNMEAVSDYDNLLQNRRLRSYHDKVQQALQKVEHKIVKSILDEIIQNCVKCIALRKKKESNILVETLLNTDELKTRNYEKLIHIAWKEHAHFHFDLQDFETALNISLEALRKFPNQSHLYYITAQYYYMLDKYEEAKIHFQTAISIDLTQKYDFDFEIKMCEYHLKLEDIQDSLNMVNNFWDQKKYDVAQKLLDDVKSNESELDVNLRNQFLFYSARELFRRKKFLEAYKLCEKILIVNENYWEVRILRAKINLVAHRYEQALQDCDLVPMDHSAEVQNIRLEIEKELHRRLTGKQSNAKDSCVIS